MKKIRDTAFSVPYSYGCPDTLPGETTLAALNRQLQFWTEVAVCSHSLANPELARLRVSLQQQIRAIENQQVRFFD